MDDERLSPTDDINEQLGYDADVSDSSQYCTHGTFIGSWWGPDYLCHWCEMGEDPGPPPPYCEVAITHPSIANDTHTVTLDFRSLDKAFNAYDRAKLDNISASITVNGTLHERFTSSEVATHETLGTVIGDAL